jgi:type II secretory pathway pseudopilin PulG
MAKCIKRIKAFTIIEALISLILMSIIIVFTYTVFNLVEKQMLLFKNENESVIEYQSFNSTFKYDTFRAVNFKMLDNNVSFMFYNGDTIVYHLRKKNITRAIKTQIDTFKIPVLDFNVETKGVKNLEYHKINIETKVLAKPFKANYYLKIDKAKTINTVFFDEN